MNIFLLKNDINYKKLKHNIVYIQNAFVLFFDNILKFIIGFVMSVLVARYFGPGRFGQINYVAAFVSIVQMFVLFGFDEMLIKDMGLGTYQDQIIIGTAIRCRLILAVAVYSFGFLLYFIFEEKLYLNIYIILGLQLFMCPFFVLKQWFQIKSLNKYIVIAAQASLYLVSIGKIVYIFLIKMDILVYAILLVISLFVDVLILTILFKSKSKLSLRQFDLSYCKHLFKDCVPLLLQNISIVFLMKINQIIVGKTLSAQELGIYSIGVTISELIYFIPFGLITAFYPKIAKAKKENADHEKIIIKLGSFNILICSFFALLCTFVLPYFVQLIYGDAYIDAAKVIRIHSWAGLGMALGASHTCFLIFENLQKYTLYVVLLGAILNFALCLLLINPLGIQGAAIATVIAQIFTNYFCFSLFKDKRTFILRTRSLLFQWR